MSLGYKIENIDKKTLIFHLEGRVLEHVETINLLHEVENAIQEGKINFICNLEKLEYLNSVGLGVLIKVLTKIRNSGGELALTNISPKIEKLLVITKLNSVFTAYQTLNEAVGSFKIKS